MAKNLRSRSLCNFVNLCPFVFTFSDLAIQAFISLIHTLDLFVFDSTPRPRKRRKIGGQVVDALKNRKFQKIPDFPEKSGEIPVNMVLVSYIVYLHKQF